MVVKASQSGELSSKNKVSCTPDGFRHVGKSGFCAEIDQLDLCSSGELSTSKDCAGNREAFCCYCKYSLPSTRMMKFT